jgi:hypothetical protein
MIIRIFLSDCHALIVEVGNDIGVVHAPAIQNITPAITAKMIAAISISHGSATIGRRRAHIR